MEQRITLVTLGVRDLDRSRRFYEALGWRGQEVERTVFFQAGGLALVLWDRDLLAADCGLPSGPPGPSAPSGKDGPDGADGAGGPDSSGFGGIVLAHNVRSPAEVDQLLAAVEAAGGTVTKPAAVNAIGFYSSAFTDPDGHAWEIAHNPGFPLAEDGSLTLPDFGADPVRPQEESGP
ncbi:VOC family protein [Streptomyces sp. ISL-66]|uniref:VOC family protein n=1 Tax=Streptomyces sp. ISL-66 TaxID=2819186 RepID=UPI001BE996EC|nr:VOC family protein [Streptomyces sp. ISL-66]MBT2471746.1 VOC family protein [Streptomyces sp. ISL-66]